ncbi:MAG: nitronate monooxygenase [Dehalococcoidia bacterium]|nr:MAG: nitronate monooxygenase [Dehalococcoidia bacterium]
MFKTRVTELLGIEHPIIGGTMQALSLAEFVAAQANAGILGILASASFQSKEELRDEIRKTSSLTDKPFCVNINLFPMLMPVGIEEYIQVALEEGVRIIETSGRSPAPYIEQIRNGGAIAMHKCARIKDVRSVARMGVDLVEIVGFECGGHPSAEEVTTLALLPQAVDTVDIPVIGGGGFGDARGFIACLALGAEGVLMGTRFLVTKECPIHDNFKQAFVEAGETGTVMVRKTIEAGRVMRNEISETIFEMAENEATLEELVSLGAGARARDAWVKGDVQQGLISLGQIVGIIHDIPTVKEVVDQIIDEAAEILNRLDRLQVASR